MFSPLARSCVRSSYRLGVSTDHSAGSDIGMIWPTITEDLAGTRTHSPSPGTPGEGRGEGSSSKRRVSGVPEEPSRTPLPEYRERVWNRLHVTSRSDPFSIVVSIFVFQSVP